MLRPGQFGHLAEDTGLVVPIGAWTIASVCQQLAKWNGNARPRDPDGPHPIRASVNLSSRQLDTGDVPATVARMVEETGIDPDWLWFEITESTLMRETTEAIATMRRLRDLAHRPAGDRLRSRAGLALRGGGGSGPVADPRVHDDWPSPTSGPATPR
jgi:EAL domain-containing protein (putative c-di-GMP-specific phosphodiesterase class I)